MSDVTRIFGPTHAMDLAQAKLALEGAGISYIVENEYYAMAGPFVADTEIWITVASSDAMRARSALEEWFAESPDPEDSGA